MKNLITIALSGLLLFGVYGCNSNTESSEGRVLIGPRYSGDASGEGEDICEINEIRELYENFSESFEQYAKKGEVKTINIFNTEIKSELERIERYLSSRTIRTYYETGKTGSYIFDAKSGKLIHFAFSRSEDGSHIFPEGYEVKTTLGTLEEVEKDAQEILEKYFDEKIDLNCFIKTIHPEEPYQFIISYVKLTNSIWTSDMHFRADKYGNIYFFTICDFTDNRSVKVPDLEDKVYIDGAKERIDEFYKDNENVVEVKDYEVTRSKILAYLPMIDSDAVEYGVDYTLVYKDGTERKTGNQFYYLFD